MINSAPIFIRNAFKAFKTHEPEVLAAVGLVGVATTAYLTGRASFEASRVIYKEQDRLDSFEKSHTLDTKEKIKLVWKLFIPATVSGVATGACIVGVHRAQGKRTAAAVAMAAVAEQGFAEYREKVVEQLSKSKEQKIRDDIAQERVEQSPPTVIFAGSGHVQCCEMFTRRYFTSNMEALKKAEREINDRMGTDMYVMLSEFYDLVGLPHTSHSDYVGWDSDKPFELLISATISEGDVPCIAFDYNYTKAL